MKYTLAKFLIVPQRWRVGREKLLQDFANFFPHRSAERQKIVQRIAGELLSILKVWEMSGFLQRCKIDDILAERDANSRLTIARFENAEREILQRKMRIRRADDKEFER